MVPQARVELVLGGEPYGHVLPDEAGEDLLVDKGVHATQYDSLYFLQGRLVGYEARTRYLHLGKVALYQLS